MTGRARGGETRPVVHQTLAYTVATQGEELGGLVRVYAIKEPQKQGSTDAITSTFTLQTIVSRVYRRCPLEVQSQAFYADLMELPFYGFHVILGLDWLTEHKAMIGSYFEKQQMQQSGFGRIWRERFVRCEQSNPDVFSDELPCLPPDSGVEFAIELYLGNSLVSFVPYHAASKELRELKAQIQELLGKGFIRPSILPWVLPVLLMKKKD
ncbi:Gag protease polyprotein-like protein [Gossypium australe]|uniref:Gag protease polyprotein-like protein n=1 Tax=Gossypium australe TaxID=47621 RepID=A0A5B6X1M0_9ROSI|nr:Gag protease polyprotein-like protein [Gossypium australe]